MLRGREIRSQLPGRRCHPATPSVTGPFNLVIDIGCYHTIPARLRDGYAAEVTAIARPGTDFDLGGISHPAAPWRLLGARGISASELRRRFGSGFELWTVGPAGRVSHFVLYHLARKQAIRRLNWRPGTRTGPR